MHEHVRFVTEKNMKHNSKTKAKHEQAKLSLRAATDIAVTPKSQQELTDRVQASWGELEAATPIVERIYRERGYPEQATAAVKSARHVAAKHHAQAEKHAAAAVAVAAGGRRRGGEGSSSSSSSSSSRSRSRRSFWENNRAPGCLSVDAC